MKKLLILITAVLSLGLSTKAFAEVRPLYDDIGAGYSRDLCSVRLDIDNAFPTAATLRDRIEKRNNEQNPFCQREIFFTQQNKTINLRYPLVIRNRDYRDGSDRKIGLDLHGLGREGSSFTPLNITINASTISAQSPQQPLNVPVSKLCAIMIEDGLDALHEIHSLKIVANDVSLAICDMDGNDLRNQATRMGEFACTGTAMDCEFSGVEIIDSGVDEALLTLLRLFDFDLDGVGNFYGDNCMFSPNPNQLDSDSDGKGDACDAFPYCAENDQDEDGHCGTDDNCVNASNADQSDLDGNGIGDACNNSEDSDEDDWANDLDNCPNTANADQADADGDGIGDACNDSDDADNDEVANGLDNCPIISNADQSNSDADTHGDACDNCDGIVNEDQADTDADGVGDACNNANDMDGDEWSDPLDNCPSVANSGQEDSDGNGTGDACEEDALDPCLADAGDSDSDGLCNAVDTCPLDDKNDEDSDGVCGNVDVCPTVADAGQEDTDSDGLGDACDSCPSVHSSIDTDVDEDMLCGPAQDACPLDHVSISDPDEDGVCLSDDNCSDYYDPSNICDMGAPSLCPDGYVPVDPSDDRRKDNIDTDGDGEGDACDEDADGDGVSFADGDIDDLDDKIDFPTPDDLCVGIGFRHPYPNMSRIEDQDGDDIGDACDSDLDGDGVDVSEDIDDRDASKGRRIGEIENLDIPGPNGDGRTGTPEPTIGVAGDDDDDEGDTTIALDGPGGGGCQLIEKGTTSASLLGYIFFTLMILGLVRRSRSTK